MEIEETIAKMQKLQSLILDFLEEADDHVNFEELTKFIEKTGINKSERNMNDLLNMILIISRNHRRETHFFTKIIQIFEYLLPDIQKNFSNIDIFNFFRSNKLMILFLIQNKVIIPDQQIKNLIFAKNLFSQIQQEKMPYKYLLYFYVKQYIEEEEQKKIESEISNNYDEDFDTFQKNCQIGENDYYVCSLIREDSIEDFIIYVNKTNYSLNSFIPESKYETNNFLLNNNPTLIEYAAFYGSIQIFKYLQLNNVKIDKSIYMYAIHGRNPELIHLIEEIIFPKYKFDCNEMIDLFDESVLCHHNAIATYIKNSYLCNEKEDKFIYSILRYYNYEFLPVDYTLFIKILVKHTPKTTKHNFGDVLSAFIISDLTIPSSNTVINDSTFSGCEFLKKVTIPSSIISIGVYSFYGCKSLECITFENPSSIESIGNNAFCGCSSLTQIAIPSSVTTIGNNAFYGCSSLTQIMISESITSIGNRTFNGCSSLKQILIPSSTTSIGNNAFSGCSSLEQITIPPSIASIKNYTFNGCSSLTQIIIPSSVTSIRNNAFEGCSSLKKITIPPSITIIESSSFFGCKSLECIEFEGPSSIKSIGNNTFYGCSSLKQITIPLSVALIGNNTFYECSSLEQIVIPASITSIANNTFNGCSSLKQVLIPPSVTSIGNNTFEGCSSLEQIAIPPSVTSIGNNAFEGCSSLEQISIPPSVTSIGSSSFLSCKSLKHVSFESPSSLASIGDSAFIGCSALDQIAIPSSVTSIGNNVFDENSPNCINNTKQSNNDSKPNNNFEGVGWGSRNQRANFRPSNNQFKWGISSTNNNSSNNNDNRKWGPFNTNPKSNWKF